MVVVRPLTEQDVEQYRVLRLRSLREHPEAFATTPEEEEATSVEDMAKSLVHPGSVTFGAFEGTQLVGIANLFRFPRAKTNHRAIVGGMYVAPEARGCGAGQKLLEAVLHAAREWAGLLDVVLAVTVGNEVARSLYLKAGFVPYSVDRRYIRVGDRYFDIEWMILGMADDGR